MQELNRFLPAPWSHGNPIDVLGDADPVRYAKPWRPRRRTRERRPVILTPQDMTEPTETAQGLVPYAHSTGKPILASWMGGAEVAAGTSILNGAGIPTFDYPDDAARSFTNKWRYTYNLRGIYETPELADDADVERERPRSLASAHDAGRTILTEFESKASSRPTASRPSRRGWRRQPTSRRARRTLRIPRRPQAELADHNPQDGRRRRAPEPHRSRRGTPGLRGDGALDRGELLA